MSERQFRTTQDLGPPPPSIWTWPEQPVPPLPVARAADVNTDEDGGLVYTGDEPIGYEHLPDELVLRGLQDLDPGDGDAVIEFLNRYGVITAVYKSEDLAPIDLRLARLGDPVGEAKNHLLDAAAFLTTARAMTRHWIAHLEGASVSAPWRETFRFPGLGDEGHAWHYFKKCLNYGLRPYTAHFEYMGQGARSPDLYQALCLQILNLVIEALPPHACANRNCDHYFIRQEGRAKAGQYRKDGVKFCSRSCARAQSQRDYREKRRKQDEKGK
jgi:hypothetical protein